MTEEERWQRLIVGLRAAHLVGLVGLGASLLAGVPLAAEMPFVLTTLVSGLIMVVIDVWTIPGHLREVAGGAILVKLGLLLWMVFDPSRQVALFWIVLVFSAIIAHAPARLRHRRMLSRWHG
jgi:ABC-type dipeptide/oligopeptide/nickel transport system permease subunit